MPSPKKKSAYFQNSVFMASAAEWENILQPEDRYSCVKVSLGGTPPSDMFTLNKVLLYVELIDNRSVQRLCEWMNRKHVVKFFEEPRGS